MKFYFFVYLDYSKLLLVGSYGTASKYSSELVFVQGDSECQSLPDHPESSDGSVGTFINDRPFVCGGNSENGWLNSCYSLDVRVSFVI